MSLPKPKQTQIPVNTSPVHSTPTHLIIICCHAIYLGGPNCGHSQGEWLLAAFQKDETPTFIQHIKTGLQLLSTDPSSLLVFSGSKTRPETEKSEARSYLDVCIDNGFFGFDEALREGVILEEQALDSFGNLLFSMIGFWRAAGTWPERVTVVSHEFKRERIEGLHFLVLGLGGERVRFVGVDPEYMVEGSGEYDRERAEEVMRGEKERGFGEWERDMRGVGEGLRGKRVRRNCWGVGQEVFADEKERRSSGVKSEVVSYACLDREGKEVRVTEEVLLPERQPWQGSLLSIDLP